MLNSFHFLRPWWFIALIPAVVLYVYYWRKSVANRNSWQQYCDPHLLKYLVVSPKIKNSSWLPHLLLAIWLTAITALSGPTWSLYAQSVYQKNIARVIVLDVSQSMNASDISPSRLSRAKYKVLDLLKEIKEGQTGMVVFSSSPFVVSPLSNDSRTIAEMVPILDSNIVPVQGKADIGKALIKASLLLSQAGFNQGQIILITDNSPLKEDNLVAAKLARDGYTTSVLGIGTKIGAPVINDPNSGGFMADQNGNTVMAHLDTDSLTQLAQRGGGAYVSFSNDDTDIQELLDNSHPNNILDGNKPSKQMETKSLWRDEGHWLIWILIILSALLARKGWLNRIC